MYQHKQISWAILAILAWVGGFAVMAWYLIGNDAALIGFLLFLLAVTFLFYALTVKVDEQAVQWYFGTGIIKKRLAFSQIADVEEVTNTFRHGLGVRITHDGWVYTASGFSALAITLTNGEVYRVGTNQAAEFKAAIEKYWQPTNEAAKGVEKQT